MKIKGFNDREQKCFDVLRDGNMHTIVEIAKKFKTAAKNRCEEVYHSGSWDDGHVESHAQSYVRNALRRLIRDGWIEKIAYGTYVLTTEGKRWVKKGVDRTASFGVKRGRKPGTKVKTTKKKKKVGRPKKAKTTKKKAKQTAKATTKKKVGRPSTKVVEKKASKVVKTKKKSNGKEIAKKKAADARKRVAKQAAVEKAQQSIAEDASA